MHLQIMAASDLVAVPSLLDADQCRPGAPHKSSSFGDVLTLWSNPSKSGSCQTHSNLYFCQFFLFPTDFEGQVISCAINIADIYSDLLTYFAKRLCLSLMLLYYQLVC
ncbi:hypothetical protein XENORESO_006425 [Xenotaenia resolanae]|uniref:Uncharacterized protein n=1 Tax=Xenotaenia resolanae TaxID=208358 RepID=A0ABV0WC20_9TELE